MLQHLVAKWLRQQAQAALMEGLKNRQTSAAADSGESEAPAFVDVACFIPTSTEAI